MRLRLNKPSSFPARPLVEKTEKNEQVANKREKSRIDNSFKKLKN